MQTPIEFVFYATHPKGVNVLSGTAKTLGLGLERVNGVVQTDEPKYRLAGLRCDSEESRKRLLAFLRERGAELLHDKLAAKETGWTEARCEEYALGYSGLDLTIVFRHSISTTTPVALWKESLERTMPWLPVFPRRKHNLVRRLDPGFGRED